MNTYRNLNLGLKMAMGFGAVCLILTTIVFITQNKVSDSFEITSRVIELRAPTAKLGVELQNGLNYSLASLRGYMLLGKQQFKTGRADTWEQQINPALARMTQLSKDWTVAANKEKLARMKVLFEELQNAQNEIEAISGTVENIPSQKMLLGEAAPRAGIMAKEITAMIDEEATLEATKERKALLGMMADVRGSLGLGLANIRAYLLTGDVVFRDKFDKFWTKNTRRFGDLQQAGAVLLTESQKGSFARFSAARKQFDPLPPQMFQSRGSDEWNLANAWLGTKAAPVAAELNTILAGMIGNQSGLMETDSASAKDSIEGLMTLLWILLGAGLCVSAFIGTMITKSIVAPIVKVADAAKLMASGDLTQRIDIDQKDEIGMLVVAFTDMTEKLREIVSGVTTVSNNVASRSQELNSSSQSMSGGATEQAASIEEITSSMEQMSANIHRSADNSQQTEKISTQAASDARDGGKAVDQTLDAMKNIADKIRIIEEIARQTNLLALNAAIEAVRAGEHGKGFAVVASEVRKLAERSQKAAGEIGELSTSSVEVAEQAGKMLQRIVPDVQKTAELVQEVTAASNEQNAGASKINRAIQQLDQVIQQNAAASEEMSATSEELAVQARHLQGEIGFFRVDSSGLEHHETAPAVP